MHETSKKIIITLIIVLLGIIFYETSILIKGLTEANKKHNSNFDIINELSNKNLPVDYGIYKVIFDEVSSSFRGEVKLTLYENETFNLRINVCEENLEFKGFYSVENNNLILKNVNNTCSEFTNCEKQEFPFTIKDRKTLTVDLNVGCLTKNSQFVHE